MKLKEKLRKLREELEKRCGSRFPHGHCNYASIIVKEKLGFKIIGGKIRNPENNFHFYHHCWNYDPKTGNYVDITLDQFEFLKGLGKTVIIPKNSELAKEIYDSHTSL